MKLRTADHAPATPAEFTPRTRQKCGVVARPLATYHEAVTVRFRTSGALNALESSTCSVYDTALGTSFQSKPTGCVALRR